MKCSDCGFLAARNSETRNLEEIEFKSRQNGNIGKQRYVLIPVCFEMVVDFDEEVKDLKKSSAFQIRTNEIGEIIYPQIEDCLKLLLNKERQCKSWAKWHQGSTPKEHREIFDRQEMLKWQAKREDVDRKWREEQDKKRSADEWGRYLFLAGITVLAVIIGALLTWWITGH